MQVSGLGSDKDGRANMSAIEIVLTFHVAVESQVSGHQPKIVL